MTETKKALLFATAFTVFICLVAALISVGCTVGGQKIKTVAEMTPKERATWMLSMYNKQFDDYQVQADRTDLTEAQKTVLREKKKIMKEVYPLIELYASYVEAGAVPSQETEKKIIDYLNQLGTMLTD